MKNKSGITLVALVVTIIVLLILAGVSLNLVAGSDGLIHKAITAREEHKKAEEKEAIQMVYASLFMDSYLNHGEITEEILKEELAKNGIITEVIKDEDGKLIITISDSNNVYRLNLETGTVEYSGTVNSQNNVELQEGDMSLIISTTEWTNENVKISIQTKEEIDLTGHTIQYRKSEDSKWNVYNGAIELSKNDILRVQIKNNLTGQSKLTASIAVSNIDKLEPNPFTPTATTKSNSVTVTASATDGDATKDYAKSEIAGYRFSKDNGSTWTDYQADGTYTFTGLTQNTTYQIKVQAKDNAGNATTGTVDSATSKTGTVTGLKKADLTFSSSPDGWTQGPVTVTVSVKSEVDTTGYTIQTSKDGTNWDNTENQSFAVNGKIYARLWDGTNGGSYASEDVSKVDKLAPKEVTLTQGTVTTSSIKVTANAIDADATTDYGKSGIAGYRFSKDNGATWTAWQTSGVYTFTDLIGDVSGVTYHIKVQAKDNAGNIATQAKDMATIKNDEFYVSNKDTLLGEVNSRSYWKSNNGSAICVLANVGGWWEPCLISTNASAVTLRSSHDYIDYGGPITFDYHGVTFYINGNHGWADLGQIDFNYPVFIKTTGSNWDEIGNAVLDMYFYDKNDNKGSIILYNGNGGSGAPGIQMNKYGADISLSSTVPIRNGYHFLGWSTAPNATTANYQAGGIYKANKSQILYAVWEKHNLNNDGICTICGEDERLIGTDEQNAKWNFSSIHNYATGFSGSNMWVSCVANLDTTTYTGDHSLGGNVGMIIYNEPIDVTNIDKIIMNTSLYSNAPTATTYASIGIAKSNAASVYNDYYSFEKSEMTSNYGSTWNNYKLELDVSTYTGMYYLKVTGRHEYPDGLHHTSNVNINNIYPIYK